MFRIMYPTATVGFFVGRLKLREASVCPLRCDPFPTYTLFSSQLFLFISRYHQRRLIDMDPQSNNPSTEDASAKMQDIDTKKQRVTNQHPTMLSLVLTIGQILPMLVVPLILPTLRSSVSLSTSVTTSTISCSTPRARRLSSLSLQT